MLPRNQIGSIGVWRRSSQDATGEDAMAGDQGGKGNGTGEIAAEPHGGGRGPERHDQSVHTDHVPHDAALETGKRKLRSQLWFDNPDNPGMTALYLERYLNFGLTREE